MNIKTEGATKTTTYRCAGCKWLKVEKLIFYQNPAIVYFCTHLDSYKDLIFEKDEKVMIGYKDSTPCWCPVENFDLKRRDEIIENWVL